MDRRCRPRSRHGSRRRRDQRAGEHLRAARLPADTGPAVPDHGSVRDGGPGTLAGGCRYGLGLHARAAAGPGRCRRQSDRDLGRARDRAIRRSGRGARRAAGAGLSRPIAGRHIFGPRELEAANANLVGGAINGGTAQAHQQLVFRPTSGHLGRPETPIGGLYLASASAHPGGGVHGGPGANAARTAIAHRRARRATFGLSGIAATAAMRRFSG